MRSHANEAKFDGNDCNYLDKTWSKRYISVDENTENHQMVGNSSWKWYEIYRYLHYGNATVSESPIHEDSWVAVTVLYVA